MPDTIVIRTMRELKGWVGREVAVGRWLTVTQEMINKFAEASGEHQWIHVDAERCRRESPFRTTVAQSNLTLSQLFYIVNCCDIQLPPFKMTINYGMNKVRYTGVVPVDSRIRGRYTLLEMKAVDAKTSMLTWGVTGERDGADTPVLIAESLQRLIES